jgi:hypothetical protein
MNVSELARLERLINRRRDEHARLGAVAADTRSGRRQAAAKVRMVEIRKDLARLHEKRLSILLAAAP